MEIYFLRKEFSDKIRYYISFNGSHWVRITRKQFFEITGSHPVKQIPTDNNNIHPTKKYTFL